ncbi:MAG: uracil-DNA glycosylase [Proteobacteria bacterium]|nr:uracil-DNA glycosylase [Pseudomonadota bacterium]
MDAHDSLKGLLGWYLAAGVDETICRVPVNRLHAAPPAGALATAPAIERMPRPSSSPPGPGPTPSPGRQPARNGEGPRPAQAPAILASTPTAPPPASAEAVQSAYHAARQVATLEQLKEAIAAFEGCALRRTATNLVFADGNPNAQVVLLGEAPGADEDRQGVPFVGQSGRLLDRMLGSIGLARTEVLISNTVFWRPPGNRTPTTIEAAVCRPFVERLIELVRPRILVALGGAAAKSLLGRAESVGRLRGQWLPFTTPGLEQPAQTIVTFHPAYLLRTPSAKREAWQDLLKIKAKLAER